MAAAQQPPHPFTSGINIKLALSSAFSTQLNPRNFEANYTPAWIATLCDACRFSNRLSVATEPYLSIPGKIINELELKAEGEELSEKRQDLNAAWENDAARNLPVESSRQSARIPLLSAIKLSDEDSALQKAERDWRYERRSVQKQKDQEQKDQDKGNVNESDEFSFDISTVNDSDAKDSRPDMSVVHIVGGTIRKPTMQDVQERYTSNIDQKKQLKLLLSQYAARAGIKTVHQCVVLIGEFKRAPPRTETDIVGLETTNLPVSDDAEDMSNTGDTDWVDSLRLLLAEAIEDTMLYCAMHFDADPRASKVIVLASAGPFWQWAIVKREQVPLFNWLTKLPLESRGNAELRVDFIALFNHASPGYYVLTTEESDAQINKMRTEMFNLINDSYCNNPTLPTDFDFMLIPDAPKTELLP